MAEQARTPAHRQTLKELEQAWLKLAADLEANQALLEAYPPGEPYDGLPTGPAKPA